MAESSEGEDKRRSKKRKVQPCKRFQFKSKMVKVPSKAKAIPSSDSDTEDTFD